MKLFHSNNSEDNDAQDEPAGATLVEVSIEDLESGNSNGSNGNHNASKIKGELDRHDQQRSSSSSQEEEEEEEEEGDTSSSSTSDRNKTNRFVHRKNLFALLILMVGAGASAAFLAAGIVTAQQDQIKDFERMSTELSQSLQYAWNDYELFALWIHESCANAHPTNQAPTATASNLGHCTREEFHKLYHYIQSRGVDFGSIQFIPNVTDAARQGFEYESRTFLQENFPDVPYEGITELYLNPETGQNRRRPQGSEPFYFPIHLFEPVEFSIPAMDINIYSLPARAALIDESVNNWVPTLTDRLKLIQETDLSVYSIILNHPGIPYQQAHGPSNSYSQVVIRVPDLLAHTARGSLTSKQIIIYDATHSEEPEFLGGTTIFMDDPQHQDKNKNFTLTSTPELPMAQAIAQASRYAIYDLNVANRKWQVVVMAVPGTYEVEYLFPILGGCLILLSSVILAIWFHSHLGRIAKLNRVRQQAEREKASIILETANKQAQSERQINEYLAHEVRNPLSSAIAALSFVSAATQDSIPDTQKREGIEKDLVTIDSSLQFINELLRNLLDMHRAACKQMTVELGPVDLLKDVLQPVAAVLFLRGSDVKVLVDCPQDWIVVTDRLRLKQVVLNLAVNSTKFVTEGFIRLRAVQDPKDQTIQILVEDSGPGIPVDKQQHLFSRFQDSLDLLNQGTGIGLCLCSHIVELLHGTIHLDTSFRSGYKENPGSQFVIDLRRPLVEVSERSLDDAHRENENGATSATGDGTPTVTFGAEAANEELHLAEIPKSLSVLFVDDDLVLRKLFGRSIQRVAPEWQMSEAASGEAALAMIADADQHFDIIFMDMYMSSVNKQLLGTEATRHLRVQGYDGVICGLSANDIEEQFLRSGADAFLLKPFPVKPDELEHALKRIVASRSLHNSICV